jgi:hypothetical protein
MNDPGHLATRPHVRTQTFQYKECIDVTSDFKFKCTQISLNGISSFRRYFCNLGREKNLSQNDLGCIACDAFLPKTGY